MLLLFVNCSIIFYELPLTTWLFKWFYNNDTTTTHNLLSAVFVYYKYQIFLRNCAMPCEMAFSLAVWSHFGAATVFTPVFCRLRHVCLNRKFLFKKWSQTGSFFIGWFLKIAPNRQLPLLEIFKKIRPKRKIAVFGYFSKNKPKQATAPHGSDISRPASISPIQKLLSQTESPCFSHQKKIV